MPEPARIEVEYDGPEYPIWVAVDTTAEAEHGESRSTHYWVCDAAEVVIPLFTTEAAAVEYIRNEGLGGHAPASIASSLGLRIRLEQFRTRGGTHVGIDLTSGPSPGTPIIDLPVFIAHVRGS